MNSNIAKIIDHTILKADAREADIRKLCEEAIEYKFCSCCVNGKFIKLVAELLKGSSVKVCTVVGFPLGAMSTEAKAFETARAVQDGADEIDMVISIADIKDGKDDDVYKDIRAVVESASGKVVKVILETCLLTDDEIVRACKLSEKAGADFVKTSTGFSIAGAKAEHVRLMKDSVSDRVKVKASGGIRNLNDAKSMIEAGADRLGCSAGVLIVNEELSGN